MADQTTDLPPKVGHIFMLTEIIMEVDPENNMGAIDLAEAILSHRGCFGALAEPKSEGPTLAEIDDLCAEHSFHYEDDESLECLLLIITDALARWGSPGMQSLADGEVAELVNHARNSNTQAVALAVALEQLADAADEYGSAGGADGKALSEAVKRARKTLNRAAELDGTQPTSGGDFDG